MAEKSFGPKNVCEMFSEAARDSIKATHEYWLNRAFVHGEQWLFRNPSTNRLEEYPRDDDRVRVTINRLLPASRTLMAKLLRRDLTFEVPPRDSDDANVKAAQKALAAITDVYVRHNWEEKLRVPLTWDSWYGGTAGMCVEWDPEAGDLLDYSPDGRPVGTGDTRESPLSVLEMFIEPGAPDAETARWWIRAQALPPGQVRDMFDMEEDPEADAQATLTPIQTQLLDLENGWDKPRKLTLVLTYYERPNQDNDKGCYAVVVGDKFVNGPHPWPFPFKDKLNLVVATETPVSRRWYGESVLSQARPIQVALNMSWSNVLEHMKNAGNARIMVPEETYDNVEEWTDTPAEIIQFNSSAPKPEYLVPPQMPQWWIDQPQRLEQEIDDLLSLQDVARGVAPPNIESGLGISILSENNDTPLASYSRSIARAFERLGHLVLKIYEDKVTETRTAVVPNRQGYKMPPDAKSFSGKDLMGNCYVEIPDDAVIPRSRAASEQRAFMLWDRRIIQDPRELARMAEMPNALGFLEAIDPDLARAERENYYMSIGRAAVPAEYDMHNTHIQAHNRFRKTATYEQLPDEAREHVDLHIQAHETMAAQEAATQDVADEVGAMGLPTASGMERPENYAPAPGMAETTPPTGVPEPPLAPSGAEMPPIDPFAGPEMSGMGPNPFGV